MASIASYDAAMSKLIRIVGVCVAVVAGVIALALGAYVLDRQSCDIDSSCVFHLSH